MSWWDWEFQNYGLSSGSEDEFYALLEWEKNAEKRWDLEDDIKIEDLAQGQGSGRDVVDVSKQDKLNQEIQNGSASKVGVRTNLDLDINIPSMFNKDTLIDDVV